MFDKSVTENLLLDGKSDAELEALYQTLLGKIPLRSPIFTPTGKLSLTEKINGIAHVKRIYDHDLDAVYRPRLRALKEQYAGRKRCFLIGNGPSLNRTDLAVLKNEVTFAVNGFFLMVEHLDWAPTFYCVEDHLVAEDRATWINNFDGPVKLFPAYLGYMFDAADDTIFYNHRPRVSYPDGFDFSHEADKITYTGCTVTFSLMQLAAYLGFEEIYLIGVDASYAIPEDAEDTKDYGVGVLDMQSDDPNHFDPDYFGKGFRWHDPQVHKMVEAYGEARRTLEGTGQAIYNATLGGKLEVFERRRFHDIFPAARPPYQVQAENDARLAARSGNAAPTSEDEEPAVTESGQTPAPAREAPGFRLWIWDALGAPKSYPVQSADDIREIEDVLGAEGHALLVHDNLTAALSARIAQGEAPQTILGSMLEEWAVQAEAALALVRRHRAQIDVVQAGDFAGADALRAQMSPGHKTQPLPHEIIADVAADADAPPDPLSTLFLQRVLLPTAPSGAVHAELMARSMTPAPRPHGGEAVAQALVRLCDLNRLAVRAW